MLDGMLPKRSVHRLFKGSYPFSSIGGWRIVPLNKNPIPPVLFSWFCPKKLKVRDWIVLIECLLLTLYVPFVLIFTIEVLGRTSFPDMIAPRTKRVLETDPDTDSTNPLIFPVKTVSKGYF